MHATGGLLLAVFLKCFTKLSTRKPIESCSWSSVTFVAHTTLDLVGRADEIVSCHAVSATRLVTAQNC